MSVAKRSIKLRDIRKRENLANELNAQKRLGAALFYGIVILLAYLAYLIFEPFLSSLAWAGVLVVVSYPAYDWLARRWGATTAAVAATVGVTLILIVPTLLVMASFVRQGVDAVQQIQLQVANGHFRWVNDFWSRMQVRFPEAGLEDLGASLRHYGQMAAGFVATRLGEVIKHAAVFVFHLFVIILAMFYLFRDGAAMVERLRQILPFELTHRQRMIEDARSLIFASVTSSLVAAAAHGLLGGVGFAVAGIKSPVFWGVMMAFLSFVPLVGSALIWVPVTISLIAGGHPVRGILLMLFCAVIVSSVDNVVRPWMISGRAEMGGLMVFISVLGGIAAFGLLGVVLGPIIVAATASLLELYVPDAHVGNSAAHAGGK
jgi:predicted PurR-regulated permease PerM